MKKKTSKKDRRTKKQKPVTLTSMIKIIGQMTSGLVPEPLTAHVVVPSKPSKVRSRKEAITKLTKMTTRINLNGLNDLLATASEMKRQ